MRQMNRIFLTIDDFPRGDNQTQCNFHKKIENLILKESKIESKKENKRLNLWLLKLKFKYE